MEQIKIMLYAKLAQLPVLLVHQLHLVSHVCQEIGLMELLVLLVHQIVLHVQLEVVFHVILATP